VKRVSSLMLFVVLFAVSVLAADFYVAVNGTPSGDGSLGKPWDLQTALNQPASLQPGDTIWLRGGTYVGRFTSVLTGLPSSVYTVRAYPGESPKIDGNWSTALGSPVNTASAYNSDTISVTSAAGVQSGDVILVDSEQMQVAALSGNLLTVNRGWGGSCPSGTCPSHAAGALVQLVKGILAIYGAYTQYMGIEVTDSSPQRVSIQAGSSPTDLATGDGIDLYGAGIKVINCVVHDAPGNGIGAWSTAPDSEVTGNIIYNNGWIGPDRLHGHGIYTQNNTGRKDFNANIVFNPFDNVIQMYGSSASFLNNFYWDRNILFHGPIVMGGNSAISNLNLTNNMTYALTLSIGYGNPNNNGINITGNYLMQGLSLALSKAVTVVGNTIFNPGGMAVGLRFDATAPNVPSDYTFDKNIYFKGNSSWPYHQFYVINPANPSACGYYWFNSSSEGYGYCASSLTSQSWQQALGYDANGSVNDAPNVAKVFLEPSSYDQGRANLAIYNWGMLSSVAVDVSALGWAQGTSYQLRNAADYFNDVLQGTYDGSGVINVPMTGHTVAAPAGYAQGAAADTFPQFGAFVVTWNTGAAPSIQPVISNVSANALTASSAAVNWNTNEATDSQVEYGTTVSYGQATALDSSLVTAHNASLANLSAKTTYHYRVKSRDAAGNLAVSPDLTFTTPDSTPPVISAVGASAITASSANIAWATDEAADSQVDYGTTTAYGSSSVLNSSLTTSHSVGLAGLSSGTIYHYRVKSRDAAGNLATSSDFTFSTSDITPPVISGVGASSLSASGAVISWVTDEPADSQIDYGTTTAYGQSSPLDSSLVSAHSVALSGLLSGVTYHYRVKSRDAAGNLAISGDFSFFTPDVIPPVISGVGSSSVTSSGAAITWATNENSDSQVEYGLTISYGSTTPLDSSLVTAHSVALGGLSSGVIYHYRVKSRDAAGNLAVSADFTFTTAPLSEPSKGAHSKNGPGPVPSPDSTPPVISAVMVSSIGPTSAVVSWNTDEPADSQVEYGQTLPYGQSTALDTTLTTTHRVKLTGLSKGTLFHFCVQSKDAAGNLAVSADYTFGTATGGK